MPPRLLPGYFLEIVLLGPGAFRNRVLASAPCIFLHNSKKLGFHAKRHQFRLKRSIFGLTCKKWSLRSMPPRVARSGLPGLAGLVRLAGWVGWLAWPRWPGLAGLVAWAGCLCWLGGWPGWLAGWRGLSGWPGWPGFGGLARVGWLAGLAVWAGWLAWVAGLAGLAGLAGWPGCLEKICRSIYVPSWFSFRACKMISFSTKSWHLRFDL